MSTLVPRSYLDEAFYSNAVAAVVSGVSTLLRNAAPKTFPSVMPESRGAEVSAFDVLALVLQDESLSDASAGVLDPQATFALVLKTKGDTIRK